MSIGLRSVIDSSLLLLVTFVFIVVLLMLLELGKGGGGGGVGTFVLIFERTGGGGGGGGGGRAGDEVIVGGGGLDGRVLCTDGTLDEAFRDTFGVRLDDTLDNADVLKRFGGKGGAVRTWCWNTTYSFLLLYTIIYYFNIIFYICNIIWYSILYISI